MMFVNWFSNKTSYIEVFNAYKVYVHTSHLSGILEAKSTCPLESTVDIRIKNTVTFNAHNRYSAHCTGVCMGKEIINGVFIFYSH